MDEDEADDLRYELAQVTAQRDMLREIVAVMQPHLSLAGQAAFDRWKEERAQRIADELHVKLLEASDG